MSTYTRSPLWYKDAIIYELNIKGFYDSNQDGIGDFAGLEQKLDYIEELGVTAIWLLPFYPSPLRDDGYDIADYYHIREAYGNIDDFKRFLDAAHDRGLQVITELVINHTSDQHPWFQKARLAPKGSPEREMYVWSDTDKKYEDVRIIFTDTETSNWTWDPVAEQYYWHRFFHHQPDLNYDNPQVQTEIFKILDYWMEMGIDGFRLDAIPYLFEREETNGENLPETHQFLKKLRKHVDDNYENVLFLAEANMWPEDSASYFGDGDECHMNYHFPLMPRMYMSVKKEDRHPITDIFEQTPAIPENCQWATFLRNHDELTLEMVTDDERDFMYKVYASDKTARINVGIRRRLAPLMDNDRNKIELLNVLLMSLPGTPVLYYGDEIGMGDNFYLNDRDGVRTPMQWDNTENAGFSEANPHSLYLPVIRDTEYSYRWVNVRRQQNTPNSLLNWTKRLLAKRKETDVFGRGTITFLHPENSRVLSFIRSYEGEDILVVVNLSRYAQSIQLDLSNYAGASVKEMFGGHHFADVGDTPYQLSMGAHGYYWLKLEKSATATTDFRQLDRSLLEANSIETLFSTGNLRKLANHILPDFLRSADWIGARGQHIESVEIHAHEMLERNQLYFGYLLLQVSYTQGLPELIQLPLSIKNHHDGSSYADDPTVVCLFDCREYDGQTMVLSDALNNQDYLHALLNGLKGFNKENHFVFDSNGGLNVEAQPFSMTHNGNAYALLESKDYRIKYYRRVDLDPIADLEIKEVLQDHKFSAATPVLAKLSYPMDKQQIEVTHIISKVSATTLLSDYVQDQYQQFAATVLENDVNPDEAHSLLNASFVSSIADLGRTTAGFHKVLADSDQAGFGREALSLHYQRSLYAGHKGQIRETIDLLKKSLATMDKKTATVAQTILDREAEIHSLLKRVFRHKIESDKIRLHGSYTLDQVGLQGDDFLIEHFDGDASYPYSQRRLRRSPAKDLASLLRGLEYAAQEARNEHASLDSSLENAYQHLASEFLNAYREATKGSRLLPDDEQDMRVLLDTFLMENSMEEVRYDLTQQPEKAIISLRGLLGILDA